MCVPHSPSLQFCVPCVRQGTENRWSLGALRFDGRLICRSTLSASITSAHHPTPARTLVDSSHARLDWCACVRVTFLSYARRPRPRSCGHNCCLTLAALSVHVVIWCMIVNSGDLPILALLQRKRLRLLASTLRSRTPE